MRWVFPSEGCQFCVFSRAGPFVNANKSQGCYGASRNRCPPAHLALFSDPSAYFCEYKHVDVQVLHVSGWKMCCGSWGCVTWFVCKCSCCGACVININHPMHACVRETYLFSTNFIGIGGANWSHLRLCCIFCDIPQFYKLTAGSHCLKKSACRGWWVGQLGRGEW